MLKVEQINKVMPGGTFSLDNISFHLPKGYICGLIGENGAGKTTLLDVIMGLYERAGTLSVNGYSLSSDEAEYKECIAVIKQESLFDRKMTAKQIGLYYGDLYKDFEQEAYLKYLDSFGIDRNKRIKELSKGMQIKVQLAFALSHNAKLFLFDEPTAGLDKHFREEFLNICMELVSDGERSIIISSHLTEDFDRIADYIAYMQDGQLLFMLDRETLREKFYIVTGEDYKVNLLSKGAIVYKEKGEYSTKAMIFNSKRYVIDDSLEKKQPDIRELMYYLVKGGKENAKAVAKRINGGQ